MIRAKKSLGQNWLKSKAILADIIRAGEVKAGDTVLEVGPGQGVLTEALLATGAEVIAVEKDDHLIEFLIAKFHLAAAPPSDRLKLIHGDILDFDPAAVGLKAGEYKIIANLPYYITGQFLRRTLESNCQPNQMILMLQKEVAERIIGTPRSLSGDAAKLKESILSISVKAYGTPKYIKTVPKKYFSPQPKVDSAILKIDNISKNFFTRQNFLGKNSGGQADLSETEFFALVKKGFAQKRKMLKGNLRLPTAVLKICNLDEKVRAENLTLGDWRCLATNVKCQMSNYE